MRQFRFDLATGNRGNLPTLFFRCVAGQILLVLFAAFANPVSSQTISGSDTLGRAGLRSIWFNSAGLGSGGKIVDWQLTVNKSRMTSYIRIKAGRYSEMMSENDLDRSGKRLGLDRLVEFAELRQEVLRAELASRDDKTEVSLQQYSLPESTIYILGSNSRITSINADSGKQNWSLSFGSIDLPNIGLGANDDYLAAVNGTTVYCFEATTGKLMFSKSCRYAPTSSPVVSSEKIFVPLLDGQLEMFPIADEGFASQHIISVGVPTARPLLTDKSVVWTTRAGHMNVAPASGEYERSMAYRLRADGAIRNTPVNDNGTLYVTSENGFLYAIDETSGALVWQASIGSEIFQAPFIFQKSVYAITNDRKLFKFDAMTGERQWDQPVSGVGLYVGSSKSRLYLTDGLQTLLVISPESGAILSQVESQEVRYVLPNRDTDRLYVASGRGIIHCIHELNQPIPHFHREDFGLADADEKSKETQPVSQETTEEDPFASEDDPFATEDDPFDEDK